MLVLQQCLGCNMYGCCEAARVGRAVGDRGGSAMAEKRSYYTSAGYADQKRDACML